MANKIVKIAPFFTFAAFGDTGSISAATPPTESGAQALAPSAPWQRLACVESASIETADEGGEDVICSLQSGAAYLANYGVGRHLGGTVKQTIQVGLTETDTALMKRIMMGAQSILISALATLSYVPGLASSWDVWVHLMLLDDDGTRFGSLFSQARMSNGGALAVGNKAAKHSLKFDLVYNTANMFRQAEL